LKIQLVVPLSFMFIIAVSSCSIDISQSPLKTPSPQVGTVPSAVSLTPLAEGSTPQPSTNIISSFPTTTIPITWDHLALSGKLIYTSAVFQGQSILINVQSLDLGTGVVTTIYQAPDGGWIDAVAVSPDNTQLIMSYATPLSVSGGGKKALYQMPVDASESPQLLFPPASPHDQYSQPEWSPDGKYVYFTHISDLKANFEVWRVPYPTGKLEKLLDNASWPRISGDGAHLVYVWIDSGTRLNRLFLAKADGSDAHNVSLTGPSTPYIIDAPMFSADNQSIYFSASNYRQSFPPELVPIRLDRGNIWVNGSIPSDWWLVPVAGGEPDQLTNIRSLSLFGNLSPDKKHIAVYSVDGVFVMNPDGSELTVLVDDVGQISGTVSWIP
jgi:Tol biopolymer transport system component